MNKSMRRKAGVEALKALFFGFCGFFLCVLWKPQQVVDPGAAPHRVVAVTLPATAGKADQAAAEQPHEAAVRDRGDLSQISTEVRPDAEAHEVGREVVDVVDAPLPADAADLEQQIQNTLFADEAVIAQDGERLETDVENVSAIERVRTMTVDEQQKYVKTLAKKRDDESIAELGGLILFDDDQVRRAAIDTLMKILSQQTGHYNEVESILADNAVFMDEAQVLKFDQIVSKASAKKAD